MTALIDWDRPDWGGHVTHATTDDLGDHDHPDKHADEGNGD